MDRRLIVLRSVAAVVWIAALANTAPRETHAQGVVPPVPENKTGLVIEDVSVQPKLDHDHAVLTVDATIRNVVDHPVSAPPLRISLLNQRGENIESETVSLRPWTTVPARGSRHLATTIVDPPYSASVLRIEFSPPDGGAAN